MQVAYTLEQCWHSVPGGSAVAALRTADELTRMVDVEVIGVAGRHRRPPAPSFRPTVPMRWLPVGRPLLYETWNRFGWPKVEAVTGMLDVCHSTVAVPAATAMASVVTVHDVAFVHTPDRFSKHGVKVMTAGLDRCRTADIVCCPSHATRNDLVALGFDQEHIRIVPWGVDIESVTTDDVAAVRQQYALPERFVLFVGTIEPRKNLSRLIGAMRGIDLPLVVAGADGWGERDSIGSDTTDAGRGADSVRFIGFVPGERLAALYAAATVFAYPSLEEGFGLPVLEAMAQGVPVVTSAGTATEEAAGGAGVLVDPTDIDSIRSGIVTALDSNTELAAAGRARAQNATWQQTAALTLAAYRDAINRRATR